MLEMTKPRSFAFFPLAALWMLLAAPAVLGQLQPDSEPAETVAQPTPMQETDVQAPATSPTLVAPLPDATPPPRATTPTLRLLRALEAEHSGLKTIRATFRQQRVDEIFEEVIESDCELWYEKPTRFRCDYADPRPMTTLILENAFYLYVPELEQVEYWEFAGPEERDQQLHMLLIGFGFKVEHLLQRYDIQSSDDVEALNEELAKTFREEQWDKDIALLQVTPLPEFARNTPFSELKVYIDKQRLLPEKIVYEDETGSLVSLKMKEIERNVPLDGELFDKDKVIPPGTEFIDKRNL